MAHRILMQVFVTGSQVVGKAFMEAYRQASSASVKASASALAREKAGGVSLDEARKILGVEDGPLDMTSAQKKYDYLFDANSPEKSGSFYLQSKIYRAMERVKYEFNAAETSGPGGKSPNAQATKESPSQGSNSKPEK